MRVNAAQLFWAMLITFAFPAKSNAQCISLTTLNVAYTQDFNTLSNTAGSTTNNLTITGWYLTETGGGARDNEQYGVDAGISTTGDTYSYGTAAAIDRALGQLRSGTLISVFGSCYTNNTGSTITGLTIGYTGEQWRLGALGRTVQDRMDFQYSTNATDLATGTWVDVNALDFSPPITGPTVGSLDGNAGANRILISNTITGLSIPNGATFWIRWTDVDATSNDDGLAVDDFSIMPVCATPQPPNINVVGNTTFCAGQGSVQLSTNYEAGIQWFFNGNLISSNMSIIVTAAGSYTATLTSNGCTSDPSNPVVITHLPVPPTPTITPNGPTTFCQGGSVTLTSSSEGGNQWYLDGNLMPGETGQNLLVNSSGSYTVIVTSGGCPSPASSPTSVIVNPNPTFGSSVTQPTGCFSADGSIQLSPTGAPGPYSFVWTGPGIIQGAEDQTNLGVGNYSVTVTIEATNCSTTYNFELSVPGGCTIVVGGCPLIGGLSSNPSGEICAESSLQLTASGLSDMGSVYGITFKYSSTQLADPYSAGTNIATVTNANLTNGGTEANTTTSFPTAGTYYIYAILSPTPENPLCRPFKEISLTVFPLPDVTATPMSQTVCSESAITEIQFSGSIPQTGFFWTRDKVSEVIGIDPDGYGNITGIVLNLTNVPQLVTFTVTPGYEDAVTCYGTPITVTILVNPMPYPYATPYYQSVCSGVPITPIVLTADVAGSVMNWTRDETVNVTGMPSSGTGDITGALVNYTNAPIVVTFTISATYTNNNVSCSCSPITVKVRVKPAPQISITGGGTFCNGSNTTLSATPGFSSYSWERYAFAGVQGTDPTLLVTKSGTYNITVTNSYGCTSVEGATVQIGDFVFNGSTSAASTTMPNRLFLNSIISSCAASKPCSVSGATGPFAYNLHTIVNPNPNPVCAVISANIICTEFMNVSAYLGSFNPANICQNYLGDMGHGLYGGTIPFEITIPAGATIVIKVGNTSAGVYCNDYELVVDIPRVLPGITVSPEINICEGEQVTLTASPASSYLWSPGGATTQNITVSPTSFTTYNVTLGYGNNGCTANAQQSIFVSQVPTVAAGPMTQTICSGNNITPINISSNNQFAIIEWTRDHVADVQGSITGNGTGDISGSLINTTIAPITVTFTITATQNFTRENNSETAIRSCPSQPIYVTVVVNPNPDVTAGPNSQTICSGNVGINISGSVPGTIFNWTRTNAVLVTGLPAIGNTTGNLVGSLVNTTNAPLPVTFTITPTFTNAGFTCSGNPTTVTVIVKPLPNVVASISSQGICNGGSINPIVLSGNISGTQFSWTRDNTTFVTGIPSNGSGNINGTLLNTTGVNQQVIFTITPGLDGCAGTPITVTVNVSPSVIGVIQYASNDQLCAGQNGGMIVNLNGRPQFNGAFVIKNLTTSATNLFIWTSSLLSGPHNIMIPSGYIPNTTGTAITYQVSWHSLFDQNGCTGTLSGAANITVYPRPVLMITDPPPGNTCTGNGLDFMVNELNNLPGGFAVEVRNANNQVIGGGSNIPFGPYHFNVAGCSTPGPLTFTFSANGPAPMNCLATPVIRTISVTDNTAPVLTGTLPGGNFPNTCSSFIPSEPSTATIRAQYTDNCTPQAALTVTAPVSNLVINGCNWIRTYTYLVSDGCGNTTAAVVTYTGADTQAPLWSSTAGSLHRTIAYCDVAALNNAQALAPQATDNCSNNITITKTGGIYTPGPDCLTSGSFTNTFIATDACGNNSVVFTQVITVVDNQGPNITATNQNTLIGNCAATMPNLINLLGITAIDCSAFGTVFPYPFAISYNNNTSGNNLIWQSPAPGTAINGAPGSVFPVMISARDDCGNTSTYVVNMQITTVTGAISGTAQVQQNASTSSLITFTGSGSSAPAGTQQYLFNYSLSINGAGFVSQPPVSTIIGQNAISVSRSHANQGTFAYRLDAVTDLTANCNGIIPGNNTATITVGAISPLDFTPLIASSPQGLSFGAAGVAKDFYVGVINISTTQPSNGQVVLRMVKSTGFVYTIGATTTSVFGTPVQNSDWNIDNSGPFFVVLTLKPGVVIPPNGGSLIGFTVTRAASVAPGTLHHMTSFIQSGSGGDSNSANNTTSLGIMAQ